MSVKNAMNAVDKNGKFFAVYQGKGYYAKSSRMAVFTVPENLKNGLYDKKLFAEFGEFEFYHDLDEGFPYNETYKEFVNDEFVKWDIEKNKLSFLLSAVSEDVARYFMNGIYFDSDNVVSTDGRKMIYTENFLTVDRNCTASCFMCKKLWAQAKEIFIGLKCTRLVFSDCEFYVEHVEGQFPPYNKVIPEFSDNYIVTIPGKKELEYFLKKAKVIDSKDPDIRYQLTNTKNESEFVFFNVKFLLDIEKFGINTLYGQDNKKHTLESMKT